MSAHKDQRELSSPGTVKAAVKRETMPRFIAGSRWEVVASSLDSLWHGPYTVTFRQVEDGGDERDSE